MDPCLSGYSWGFDDELRQDQDPWIPCGFFKESSTNRINSSFIVFEVFLDAGWTLWINSWFNIGAQAVPECRQSPVPEKSHRGNPCSWPGQRWTFLPQQLNLRQCLYLCSAPPPVPSHKHPSVRPSLLGAGLQQPRQGYYVSQGVLGLLLSACDPPQQCFRPGKLCWLLNMKIKH